MVLQAPEIIPTMWAGFDTAARHRVYIEPPPHDSAHCHLSFLQRLYQHTVRTERTGPNIEPEEGTKYKADAGTN